MSSAVQLTEKGHAQYKAGNYAAAIDIYDKALTTAKLPAHLVALQSNRAACFLRLKNYTKAAEACSGVLQLDPSHEGVLLLRARTLQTIKDFKAALFDCNRLLQLKPSNATYMALHTRLQEQIADCAELSAITEHDVITSNSSQAGAAAARHSSIEARSGRKVSFGVGSQTDTYNPHSLSSSTSPKERPSQNPRSGNDSDPRHSTASSHLLHQTLEKLPTQSPTQKVAFLSPPVAFAPSISIPGVAEHGDQQPPSPISEKIQKRVKTPHQGVVDSEVPFEDAQLPPHSPIPLSQGTLVGGVKKGLPNSSPTSFASGVFDASSNPSSPRTEDAKEFRAEDCDKYTTASFFKTLEVSPRIDREVAQLREGGGTIVVQKNWNGIEGPAYVRQQVGKKIIEGEATIADVDRTRGGGGGAKGYRLPVMPMAPLPYDANPSRVEVGSKKVVIQMDPEVKAKAVVSVQLVQKKTDYSSWDNLEVSSDEEEEPKPQYHYKITNMKVQAVADK